MKTVIPGALADHLTTQTITDTETAAALDGAHRGRGRTLVIEPTNTRVLHVISAYAKAILENRKLHTPAQVRAARLWIQRAGHAPAPATEPAPAAVRDEPSDWWTIMDPATGEEIARVYGETWQEMTPRAEALPEVRAVIRAHKGFTRRRLYVSELTPEQRAEQAEAAAEPVVVPADQVAAGDTVLGCYPEQTTVEDATPDTAIVHAEPYRAAPTPYRGGSHCQACAVFADHSGPVVTLAIDTPWDMCDPIPAADPVLIRRATAAEREQAAKERADTEQFDRSARAVDAVEYAEQVEANVETVEDAEAVYAAALVTEAEATDGTWRGDWIGEQPADDVLFVVDGTVEQGALFDDRATEQAPVDREPVVVRMRPDRTALALLRAKAADDREAYRARMDERQAAEHRTYGAPVPAAVQARIDARRAAEQAPERRVIEGVVVSHGGTAEGSKPKDATNPDVVAAREALAGLAVATLTDHHDVTEPTEDERNTRGYFVDPRTYGRVAVYWLERGRIVRRDQMPHGPALDCLADRLKRRGWAVEKMLRSSQCVFAHRPSTD
ncbi:hypothetical protein ACFWDF_02960 [Streptomyces diastaticus]|uniref:hypothetical protein n=1 Tax=Streptomyces diastaticus TaxID=1956 RepID=UPI0036B91912